MDRITTIISAAAPSAQAINSGFGIEFWIVTLPASLWIALQIYTWFERRYSAKKHKTLLIDIQNGVHKDD